MNTALESCAEVFGALSDPSRRQILDKLAVVGPQSASTLAGGMTISRQAVIKHLASLTEADLVVSRRNGREVLFSARPERLTMTAQALDQVRHVWSERLWSLKAAIETSRPVEDR